MITVDFVNKVDNKILEPQNGQIYIILQGYDINKPCVKYRHGYQVLGNSNFYTTNIKVRELIKGEKICIESE